MISNENFTFGLDFFGHSGIFLGPKRVFCVENCQKVPGDNVAHRDNQFLSKAIKGLCPACLFMFIFQLHQTTSKV